MGLGGKEQTGVAHLAVLAASVPNRELDVN